MGCPAVALTDLGHGYGLVDFAQQAKQIGDIKPIFGAKLWLTPGARFDPQMHPETGTIVLLAETNAGYENLLKLLSIGSLEGELYGKQRIDWKTLEAHSKGLILLTSDTDGALAKALEKSPSAADKWLEKAQSVMPAVYGEMIAKRSFETKYLNNYIAQKEVPHIVSSAARYLFPADQKAAEILYCIGKGGVYSANNFKSPVAHSPFQSWEAMLQNLDYIDTDVLEKARKNGIEISEKMKTKIKFGQNLLPHFPVPEGQTTASELRRMCHELVAEKYPDADKELLKTIDERIDYELSVIGKMGFEAYFLIVEDFIRYAKENGIAVGPGRGSAAGSIVSYLLGITTIDPIGYELLFERFLNPERISMPDIDIDFSDERREEVMEYVYERYGRERVSKVCTFGTLSAKAALKDVGRAFGVEFSIMNGLTKLLPSRPGLELADAEQQIDFMTKVRANPLLSDVFAIAKKVEGCPRHVSVHACAVIIARDPLDSSCPLQWSPTDDNTKITQYPYQQLEEIGLLKMDFLGLKNLSVLEKTLANINQTTSTEVDLDMIPIDDEKVFEMIGRGETTGVFQFESAGMRRYLQELKPTEFEDLVAMNALYRPGPMEYIPQYINGKHDPKKVKYMHPVLEPLLKKTYGIAVYQEQILRIAQDFSGFSLGEADILRKAIGKKIARILNKQRKKFIEGAVEKGYDEALAVKMFDEIIVPFSGYGFNRSHAVCYARIAYETAWCRANYPVQFMAAMMTADRNNTDRIAMEMNECAQMEIEVLPPDVNSSDAHFTVVKTESGQLGIRFGLTAIKGLGEGAAMQIMNEQKMNGGFADVTDFIKRVPAKLTNKKTFEALTYAGALDSFGNRGAIVAAIPDLLKYAKEIHKSASTGQVGLFGDSADVAPFVLPQTEATSEEILLWEKEALGLYVSDHPLRPYTNFIQENGTPIIELNEDLINKKIVLHGMITKVRRLTTKAGKPMAILQLMDHSGELEIPVFPNTYASINTQILTEDAFVKIEGKVNNRDETIGVVANMITTVVPKSDAPQIASEKVMIEISPAVKKSTVDELKILLKEHMAENGATVQLKMGTTVVDVPFLVEYTNELDRYVKGLLG